MERKGRGGMWLECGTGDPESAWTDRTGTSGVLRHDINSSCRFVRRSRTSCLPGTARRRPRGADPVVRHVERVVAISPSLAGDGPAAGYGLRGRIGSHVVSDRAFFGPPPGGRLAFGRSALGRG